MSLSLTVRMEINVVTYPKFSYCANHVYESGSIDVRRVPTSMPQHLLQFQPEQAIKFCVNKFDCFISRCINTENSP